MLGVFITRGLVLVLGYAYPAFECYKTVEKNRVEIEELRCWCQYWIIVAMLTVFESVGDIFISWLPMYGEMKVALIVYLWYPKTKGTGYIYGTFLRPYIAKYEPDIDRYLQELRTRAWDLVIHHCQNCTKLGQTTLVQIITYLAAQPAKFRETKTLEKAENHHRHPNLAAPPSRSPRESSSSRRHRHQPSNRRPPLPPTHMGVTSRAVQESPKWDPVQVHLRNQAEFTHTQQQQQQQEQEKEQEQPQPEDSPTDESKTGGDSALQAARLRLRRSKGFH